MDAITLLKRDHQTVEKLFKRFEKAGDAAHAEKRQIVDSIIEELSMHAAVEEQLFYPVTRATVPETEDDALESLEEHHVVKWLCSELDGMDPAHERFDAKVTVLIESVRHHVEEEEGEYFPKVRDELGRKALAELGDALEKAKAVAPTHPHPRQPDTPPGNMILGTAAGVVDRVGDTLSGIAEGGVAAAQDVIAQVLGTKKPAATRGSTTSKKAARGTRKAAARATTATKRTAKAAGTGARSAAKTASSGARSTARTASAGAKRTSGSAKKTGGTAKAAARRTAGSAKKTAGTARKAAGRTTGTARKAATSTAKSASTSARRSAAASKGAASRTTAKKSAPRKTTARKTTARKSTARSS